MSEFFLLLLLLLSNETSHSLCGSGSSAKILLFFYFFCKVHLILLFLFFFVFILFRHFSLASSFSISLSIILAVQHVSMWAFYFFFTKNICNTRAHIHREKCALTTTLSKKLHFCSISFQLLHMIWHLLLVLRSSAVHFQTLLVKMCNYTVANADWFIIR